MRILIVWLGTNEVEWFDGTLVAAIEYVNTDERWANYGRKGAEIYGSPLPIYEVAVATVERHSGTEWKIR